jgi:hypothetical protein
MGAFSDNDLDDTACRQQASQGVVDRSRFKMQPYATIIVGARTQYAVKVDWKTTTS